MKQGLLFFSLSLLAASLIPGCQSLRKTEDPQTPSYPAFSIPPLKWTPPESDGPGSAGLEDILKPDSVSEFNELHIAGQNIQPSLSPDGERLVYTSFGRNEHANYEIYEYELKKSVERRLTFQRGEVLFPIYHPHQQKVIYSSSNEEETERPELSMKRLRERVSATPKEDPAGFQLQLPSTEIFLRDLSDLSRDRLTESPGFDGESRFIEGGRRILFSSARTGDTELYTMDIHGRQIQRITSSKGYDGMGDVTADDQTRVWIHIPPQATESHMLISRAPFKKIETVPLPAGLHWSPLWSGDGEWIIFSSHFQNTPGFALYAVRADGRCLTRLTSDNGHAIFPAIHPVSGRLFYSRHKNGRWVLGWRYISLPKTCLHKVP